MTPSFRSPQALVEGLQARERTARHDLWLLLRDPIDHLMTRLIQQHRLDEDRDLLTRHALHAVETSLRSRSAQELTGLSWAAFRGAMLLQVAKLARQPFGNAHPGLTFEPAPLPDCPDYQSETFFRPYTQLGGHFFGGDWYAGRTVEDGSFWVFLADVTGHGYYAYLLASALPDVWLRCWRAHPDQPPQPAELLGRMHDMLEDCLPEGIFLECTLVRLDGAGQAVIVPAGGTRLVLHNGADPPRLLRLRGGWLGFRAPQSSEAIELCLQVGEEMLMATDGVFDQLDDHGGIEVVTRTDAHLPGNLLQRVRLLLDRALASGPQRDDITMVLLRRRTGDPVAGNAAGNRPASSEEGNVPV